MRAEASDEPQLSGSPSRAPAPAGTVGEAAAPARSEKWQARRDAIVDASAQVFARRGYHATGIAELCTVNGLG
ncbi:MAG: hypothetical protein WEG56_13290, partial [Chloroflexota bacterium]